MHPIKQFTEWFEEAKACKAIADPTAMALATVSAHGEPSVRMVLLKGYDERGFVFYTNMQSRKGRELHANQNAALCFYWMPLMKQVRIEGSVVLVSDAEADAYFASRPRESQIGAWASQQSDALENLDALHQAVEQITEKFEHTAVPRPPFWSGFRIVPHTVEFWQQGDFRLHKRELYQHTADGWVMSMLYP